jgi:polyisoprenoid-binding protein YceI
MVVANDQAKELAMSTQTAVRPFQGTFAADPIHSSFGFAVTHMGVSTFRGTLSDVQATLRDDGDGLALEGAAAAESISITDPAEFRAHVLAPDFLDAENHPHVTFRSGDVQLDDDGSARVKGELAIGGVSRPVTASGRYVAPLQTPGGLRGALELEATIDRREYGIDWQMELPSGGDALGYDVTISVQLELVSQDS